MKTKQEIDRIVEKLFSSIEFKKEPVGLYDPLRYMISIGGKRIRPALCVLTYSLFKDNVDGSILNPAAALEVFHTFTLIHDDIMDRSPLRRKMPTVWKKWDGDHAILSGDVMLIDAYQRLCACPGKRQDEVFKLFSKTASEVCEGQQYDMDFESIPVIGMDDYEKMIGLKTAVLLACSAQMGAIIADAPEEECRSLYKYGYDLGMAFQIADDYLDAYGDEKVFGKPIGGDIINSKKSWLTVRALEKTEDKEGFLRAFESKAETDGEKKSKIDGIRLLYDTLGVQEEAKKEVVRYSESAIREVSSMNFSSEALDLLREFADGLVGRAR
ncbi:MAG: polyprenyl synthetase family protein [Bacteroidales bacterium]|nr:polyprenyl synthetase family protein [Bacteroidales bacterium]